MPGPPPPPPPSGMPPPPPAPTMLPKSGKPDDRAALLKSIQKGTKLKKTVTNDKSAPMIGGKLVSNNNTSSINTSSPGGTPVSTPNGLNLGGLFAGGMPKLKPTGKLGVSNQNSSNNVNNNENSSNKRPVLPPQPIIKNSSNIHVQNELKKQMASDNRNRGPPPPAPVKNASEESNSRPVHSRVPSANGLYLNQSSLHSNSNLQIQNSTLHRKVKSNASLHTLENNSSDSVNGFSQTNKPVISHGKPNLAPKPPALNAKPTPPKKLMSNGKPVSRAHSMKSPRSPSPQSPDTNVPLKFGTVRNLSSVIGQSLANSTGNLSVKTRPMLNGRPNAPPPSIPSQQPPPPPQPLIHGNQAPLPPSKTGFVKPPSHAPPPPPSVLPQPPNHTPPPPPHRMIPSRAPPAIPSNNNCAPPPPPRHSSMTSNRKIIMDLEDKYKSMFHDPSTFPKPPPYRNISKNYGSRQAGNKQQAPQPPNLQSSSRTWDASSAC